MAALHDGNSDGDSDEEDAEAGDGVNGEREEENGEEGSGLNLTSFLFGNIDQSGQLEEEFLDESTRRQLGSLGSMLADTNRILNIKGPPLQS